MRLYKLHGLGNDFLIAKADEIDLPGLSLDSLTRRLCHRHAGIGADGILFFQCTVGDHDADVSALIFNADGSRAEMSGNGTRCLAAYLLYSGTINARTVRIRTVAGVREFDLKARQGRTYTFTSSLGQPVTDPAKVPAHLGTAPDAVIDYPLPVGSEIIRVTVSSMGNPHCSTFWPSVDEAPVGRLGPLLERHECFPHRANIEFVEVLDRHRIRVRFWERGVGPTLASGTGSAAAAVAAILNGLAESPITVELARGSLLVDWRPPGELRLTGGAEYICSVEYPL